jgi:predicted phage-related endonuclease
MATTRKAAARSRLVGLDDLADVVGKLRKVRQRQDKLALERVELEHALKAQLGEAEQGTIAGVVVVVWKHYMKSAVSLPKLRQLYPDAAASCTEVSEFRTFKVVESR